LIEAAILLVALAVVIGLVGVAVGMLLARPLSRLAERDRSKEEEERDGRA
jgi:NhaP-type Na+/H+ or K+/H+ antiporter